MSNLSLFGIGLEYRALFDLIENDLEVNEETGEITDNSEQFKQLFNGLNTTFEDKLDNCQRYCITLDGEAEILANEIKRLQARKKAIENKKDRLKKEMLSAIKVSGNEKIKTSLYNFNIKHSEAVNIVDEDLLSRIYLRISYNADKTKLKRKTKNSEAEKITNEDLLARTYLRIKYEADKTKIKEAIKNGEVVEGASLVQNESLTVK